MQFVILPVKLALERVQADAQNAARDTKWPTMNAKVAFIISGIKSVWAFNNLEFIADVKSYGQLAVFSLVRNSRPSFLKAAQGSYSTKW